MCTYHAVTMITFGLLTPMIVCAMALERYFGIRHGYFYMCHFNATRARSVTSWPTYYNITALDTQGDAIEKLIESFLEVHFYMDLYAFIGFIGFIGTDDDDIN